MLFPFDRVSRGLWLAGATLLAGCHKDPSPKAIILSDSGALTRSVASASPPASRPSPPLTQAWMGPKGRTIRLHDAGGTIFVSVDEVLYRAAGGDLLPLALTFEPGTAQRTPRTLQVFEDVFGHYPENVWVQMKPGYQCKDIVDHLIGRLEGTTVTGHHLASDAPGSRWIDMSPWLGSAVIQFGDNATIFEGGGQHPAAGDRAASGCARPSADLVVAHRGWVLVRPSCDPREASTTWLHGPAGQHHKTTPFAVVVGLQATAQGEVWALGQAPATGGLAWQLCRVDLDPSDCEELPARREYSSLVVAKGGGFLLLAAGGVLARPRRGELFPTSLLGEEPRGWIITHLRRGADGILWGIGSSADPSGESIVFRSPH